jgi:hypothetical protein
VGTRHIGHTGCDPLAAAMNPRFSPRSSTAPADRPTRSTCSASRPPSTVDRRWSWRRPTRITPCAERRRRRRDDVTGVGHPGRGSGAGRGVADRWEVAVEVDEPARHQGLGRATGGRRASPGAAGEPVWAQQAAGNARSIRAFQSAGYRGGRRGGPLVPMSSTS